MEIKIKKLSPEAVIPKYETEGSVGMDITATSKSCDSNNNVVYGTGLSIEIPKGYYADLRPRSSISKYDLVLANSIGTIDSDYRGELIFKFKKVLREIDEDCIQVLKEYDVGDRIGQIVILPYPKVSFVEVEELSSTDRGEGGFGSTGIDGGTNNNDKA